MIVNKLNQLDPNTDNVQIVATKVIGVEITVYGAWKRAASSDEYSTITYGQGVVFGRLGTERLPDDVSAMPYGLERYRAAWAHYDAKRDAAVALIRAAGVVGGDAICGEVEVCG